MGVPHLLVYCWSKAICVVVLQPKCPSLERGDEPVVEGYYATMYGCSCERVLTLEQLVVFFKNKRPQDRCVLLDGQTETVAQLDQPSHYSHHLSLRPRPKRHQSSSLDELIRELRFWAQRRSATTGELNAPNRLKEVRRVASEILKKRSFVLTDGDASRFNLFIGGADDDALMVEVRGSVKVTIWDLYIAE